MYFDIIVIFMIVFLIFLVGLELNNYVFDKRHTYPMELSSNTEDPFEDYDSIIAEFKKLPKVLELSYENQYKIENVNKINNKAFVFYENDICRDLNSDNSKLHSITRELSCDEMNEYLNNIIKIKYNESISSNLLNEFANIPVENWGKEKIILNNIDYKVKEIQLKVLSKFNKIKSINNYVNLSQKIKYINVVINKLIEIINGTFETTKYYDKYNKYHPFESYKLTSYKILKFYIYEEGDEKLKYQRGIIKLNIHRLYKTNDFTILLDIFFIPRDNFAEIFKEESDFKDAYHFFIKTIRVIGNPLRHQSRFLEEDDTNYTQTDYKIITEDMYKDLTTIKKLEKEKKFNNIEQQYNDVFNEIKVINQNKTFNSIVFRELLFKFKKISDTRKSLSDDEKSEIEILFEKLIEKFIIHCKEILNYRKILKKDLDQDIPFSIKQLNGQTIFTDEINELTEIAKKSDNIDVDKLKLLRSKYRCYDPRYSDKVLDEYVTRPACISYHEDIGVNGVYDKKCEKDEDCPFYKSNTNYPNDFGGCNKETGMCQVPTGLSIIGGTKVSSIGTPSCYNCDKVRPNKNISFDNDRKCCHLQFNNPDFQSPDFMFENDTKTRFNHRSFLEDKGLKP